MLLCPGRGQLPSNARCIHTALSFCYTIDLVKLSQKGVILLQMIKPHPSHSLNKYPFILQPCRYNNRAQ